MGRGRLARARRRGAGAPIRHRTITVLKCGDIELDRETHRVHRKSREVRLGPTEFRLLEFLMSSPSRVFCSLTQDRS